MKRRRPDGKLRLGMMWPNSPTPNATSRPVAERSPDVLDLSVHMRMARIVEGHGGADFIFFADGYTHNGPGNARVGHGEPCIAAPIWAPVVMAATNHIGVVTTMHTRYLAPAAIARFGANLDQVSGGRWGWNVVPGAKASELELFGLDGSVGHDERYAMATESVEVVKLLWSADGEEVSFKGRFHEVHGIPRGPGPLQQPHPLLFNAGVSPAAQELIGSVCDRAFFVVADNLDDVRDAVDGLAVSAERYNRAPEEVIGHGSVGIIVGNTTAEAEEKYKWVLENVDQEAAEGWANAFLSGSQSYQARFGHIPVEEAARKIGVVAGSRVLVGTGPDVAEQMIDIHRQTGLRGFMMAPIVWALEEIELWADIYPTLVKSGIWTPPSERAWSW